MKLLFSSLVCLALFTLGSCKKKGCTDDVATNYQAAANFDDGSCKYLFGCTDSNAINWDTIVGIDDGSCLSFTHWDGWVLASTKYGMDTSIASAHKGNDTLSVRDIYFLNDYDPIDSIYPVGTMIINHVYSLGDTIEQFAGMAKREAGFNPTGNDWEWFLLNEDGSFAEDNSGELLRGANLLDNYCADCHANAAVDFVFSKKKW